MSESKRRARYTLEYKLEAVRLVKGGQVAAVTAKILDIPSRPWRTGCAWPTRVSSREPGKSR